MHWLRRCETKCPSKTTNEFDEGLSLRKAIYKPFAQAVPSKPTIDPNSCRKLTEGKCGVCAKICPTGAIRYDDTDRTTTETFGAIILATGYDLIDWTKLYGEYGGGNYPDVITGLQFERLVNASGPTEGISNAPATTKSQKPSQSSSALAHVTLTKAFLLQSRMLHVFREACAPIP